MPLPRNALRTAEIDINCHTLRLDELGGLQKEIRVVCAKLHNHREVVGARREVLRSVLGVRGKKPGVEHWRVGQLGAVASAQDSPCLVQSE